MTMETPELNDILRNTQPYRCNPDGIVRVWAYIGGDDPMRGESRGATGLAQRVAEKLNGRILYVDEDMLNTSFPNTKSMAKKLEKLIERNGRPDIVIGHTAQQLAHKTDADPTFLIDTILPHIAKDMLPPTDGLNLIVPHHLTPDILAKNGQEFSARHCNMARPLTAIFLADLANTDDTAGVIADTCLNGGRGTLYFCPSTRTNQMLYSRTTHDLDKILKRRGLAALFNVIAPPLDEVKNGFNPYIGLIDQADHAVLIGESQSIMSEAIINGRPLHIHSTDSPALLKTFEHHYQPLADAGYVRYLHHQKPNQTLNCTRLPPIDTSDIIATKIANDFDRSARVRTLRPGMMALQNPCCLKLKTPGAD